MITQQSFMFISSYEGLRKSLMEKEGIEAMIHVGPHAFAEIGGEKVNTTLYVLRREPDASHRANSVGVYFRLVREPDSEAKQRGFERTVDALRAGDATAAVYRYRQGNFAAIPGAPWVYWITPGLRQLFLTLPKLGEAGQPRQGLVTADNFRFLRYWWEVGTNHIGFGCTDAQFAQATSKQWFPYMKGGSFRRWWGNQQYIVNWANDGAEIKEHICFTYPYLKGKWNWVAKNPEYYFRCGVTWSKITSGSFSARFSPTGFIFSDAGSSVFPPDIPLALAILNSTFAAYALKLINPTVNFQVGDLARLPIPITASDTLHSLVERAVALAQAGSTEDETTYEFVAPPAWLNGLDEVTTRASTLADVEHQIDEEVYRLYGISAEDRQAIEVELAEPALVMDDVGENRENEPIAEDKRTISSDEIAPPFR
jgi:hypothetical protein